MKNPNFILISLGFPGFVSPTYMRVYWTEVSRIQCEIDAIKQQSLKDKMKKR